MYKFVNKPDLLSRESRANQWFIKNLLPSSGTTIVYGVPGEGKSTICLEWALALQNGLPFAGYEPLQGDFPGELINTAWLSFEDDGDEEMTSRLSMHDMNLEWPIYIAESTPEGWADPTSLLLDGTNGMDANGGLSAGSQQHWDNLGKRLQVANVKVLFIDTLNELAGTDASARQVQNCFRLLSGLRDRFGVRTVLIGHSSSHAKEGRKSTELMGATAWTAKSRHSVLIDGNTTTTWAKVMKSNRGPTGFNVTMAKVDGGPVTVLRVNSQSEYIAEKQKSNQKRDWEKKREQATKARDAGSDHWTSEEGLGKAAGGSKSIGKAIIASGYFRQVGRGKYEPINELIDADWDSWNASQSSRDKGQKDTYM